MIPAVFVVWILQENGKNILSAINFLNKVEGPTCSQCQQKSCGSICSCAHGEVPQCALDSQNI